MGIAKSRSVAIEMTLVDLAFIYLELPTCLVLKRLSDAPGLFPPGVFIVNKISRQRMLLLSHMSTAPDGSFILSAVVPVKSY